MQKILAPRVEADARVKLRRRGVPVPPPLPPPQSTLEPPMPIEDALPIEADMDEVQAVVRTLEHISREVPAYESYEIEVAIDVGDADIVESISLD